MKTWPDREFDKGVLTAVVPSWTKFQDVVQQLLDFPHYSFRGHRRDDWLLESTLTRELKGKKATEETIKSHIQNFRYAARGRRGPNPPKEIDDNLMWALGQHHGLSTPLLDWSASPYVALFFAFAKSDPATDTEYRVVFGLNMKRVWEKNKDVEDDPFAYGPIEFFNPLSDENSRLVSQGGLFTKLPYQQDLEKWIKSNFASPADKNNVYLVKLLIPSSDRISCLKALNRMNINYSTLFPDIEGASKHCNLKLEITNY